MPRNLSIFPFLAPVMLLLSACGGEREPSATPRRIQTPDSAAKAELTEILGPVSEDALTTFGNDVKRLLPPLDSVETALGRAFAADTAIKLYGVIIPYRQSIVTADSGRRVYIGLNHYLGPDYEGYRGAFPSWTLNRKRPARIPVEVVQAVIAAQNPPQFSAENPTLLNRLIYQGALLLATAEVLGEKETPESVLTGLDAEQTRWCHDNEGRIWAALIERNLLYSTDPTVADRLLSPARTSGLISASAPGQAVLTTALEIAKAYRAKTGLSGREMLRRKVYNDSSTLIKSEYSPNYATL